MQNLANGIIYYIVFLFSTTLHEAAHAWAAKLGGDLTAYHGGQVTLDPRPHIKREPFGMLILPLISAAISGWPFGFASAPYDPEWALKYPKRAAWMALAGPGGNLVLVVVAALLIRIGIATGVFAPPDAINFGGVAAAHADGIWRGVAFMVSALFSMNLALAILNLLPLPPLDGSAAIPLFLPSQRATRYQHFLWSNRGLGIFGMLVAWQVFAPIFNPVFLFAVNLVYPGLHYGQ